jgi:hypothetical protein
VTDLAEFLLACIGEEETEARRLLRRAQDHELAIKDPSLLGRRVPGWHDWPTVQRMVSRALADCDAKRSIVKVCEAALDVRDMPELGGRYLALDVLPLLALPYADLPDYREEWRP